MLLSPVISISTQLIPVGPLLINPFTVAIFLAFILLTESLILWGFDWGSYPISLFHAFLMNLASVIVVFFVLFFLPDVGIFYIFIAAVLSIAIEGLVLTLLRRQEIRKAWLVAIVVNLVSTAIIIAAVYIKDFFV
ncbi:MAG: hypothetical protein MUO67_02125 [Anaerolineales bacterium]|nr:hypothetical protein [Anaerolineales bacterium]